MCTLPLLLPLESICFQDQAFCSIRTFTTRHTLQCHAALPNIDVQCNGVLSVAGVPESREGAIRHASEDLLQIRLTRALTSW
jgi:hypothetical protein